MLKLGQIIILSSVVFSLSTIGVAAAGEKVLKKKQTEELLLGNTVIGHQEIRRYDFKTFVDPLGFVRSSGKGKLKHGESSIDKKGRHCVQWKNGQGTCAVITYDGKVYRKYKKKRNGKHIITFTVEKGNPYNL